MFGTSFAGHSSHISNMGRKPFSLWTPQYWSEEVYSPCTTIHFIPALITAIKYSQAYPTYAIIPSLSTKCPPNPLHWTHIRYSPAFDSFHYSSPSWVTFVSHSLVLTILVGIYMDMHCRNKRSNQVFREAIVTVKILAAQWCTIQ